MYPQFRFHIYCVIFTSNFLFLSLSLFFLNRTLKAKTLSPVFQLFSSLKIPASAATCGIICCCC